MAKKRDCKHSKGVEAYYSGNRLILWCYSCGTDVNKKTKQKNK
jgi:hypothetical protein